MTYFASLSMYARPELNQAYRLFWAAIGSALRDDGFNPPDALTEDGFGYTFWQSPHLLLSQTCGYPYRMRLRDRVNFVGTLDYGVEGCPSGSYRSVIVASKDSPFETVVDLAGARFAYNDDQSQSGYHGPLSWAENIGLTLVPSLKTNAHRLSVEAIVARHADVASIDAITWRFIKRYDTMANKVRVIAQTPAVPGLPLICAKAFDAKRITQAVERAIERSDKKTLDTLSIKGLSPLRSEDYTAATFAPHQTPEHYTHIKT